MSLIPPRLARRRVLAAIEDEPDGSYRVRPSPPVPHQGSLPMKSVVAAALLAALAPAAVLAASAPRADSPFQAARLSRHIKVLSSDAFEGRGPATPGEVKSVDYIVSQMK